MGTPSADEPALTPIPLFLAVHVLPPSTLLLTPLGLSDTNMICLFSGCILISYGCEAGNDNTLKTIKKGIKLEQVKNAVQWTNEVGIKNSVNFIIGHPGETYETAMDSIRFAKSLPTNFVNFYNLVPYPGTELFDWVNTNAHFLSSPETYLNQISYRDNSPIFETEEFTKKERSKVIKKGFSLYEKRILQFRLGKKFGYAGYLATRIRPIAKIGRNFIQNNSEPDIF